MFCFVKDGLQQVVWSCLTCESSERQANRCDCWTRNLLGKIETK